VIKSAVHCGQQTLWLSSVSLLGNDVTLAAPQGGILTGLRTAGTLP
jgi:hypothetical protein